MIKMGKNTIMKNGDAIPGNQSNNPLLLLALSAPQVMNAIQQNKESVSINVQPLSIGTVGTEAGEPVLGENERPNRRRGNRDRQPQEIGTIGTEAGEPVASDQPIFRLGTADDNNAQAFTLVNKIVKDGTTMYRLQGQGNNAFEFQASEAEKGMRYRVKSKNGGTFDYMVGNNGKVMLKHNNKKIVGENGALPNQYKNDLFLHFAMNGPEVLTSLQQNRASSFIKLGDIKPNIFGSGTEAGEPVSAGGNRQFNPAGTEAGEPVAGGSSGTNGEMVNRDMTGMTSTETPTGINPNGQSQEDAIANSGVLIGGTTVSNSALPNKYGVSAWSHTVLNTDIKPYDPNTIAEYTIGSGNNTIEFALVHEEIGAKQLETRHLPNKTEEISDVCLTDLFRTSGATNIWKVFDDEGYSNVNNVVPGAIYDLSDFNGAFFKVVEEYERNPIRIELGESIQGTVTNKNVSNPQLVGQIRQSALVPILTNIKGHNYGANLVVNSNYERMYDSKQIDMSLGGTVPYAGNKVSFGASFGQNSESESYSYSLELTEPYYTLNTTGNTPATGNFFVDESLNSQKKFGYVSSVIYGRRIIATFNSSYSLEEMEAAANMDAETIFGDYNASFNYAEAADRTNITYSIQIQGGSTNNNLTFTDKEGSLETLLADLTAIANNGNEDARDGVPIQFVVKTLGGNLVTSDYSPIDMIDESCNPTFKLSLMQIEGAIVNEGQVADNEIELYGSWNLKKYNSNGEMTMNANYDIADRDDPIKFHEKATKAANGNIEAFAATESRAGNVPIAIFHDDLTDGYIKITINTLDKDSGSADDYINGSTANIYVRDFDTTPLIVQSATGDGNNIKFHFQLIQD